MRIAALYTCYNRKEKTLRSLSNLFKAQICSSWDISLTVYLTDDNSSDGTGAAVSEQFPQVKILKGSGSLYWAGGMRYAWNQALTSNYDAYLLLNDDTEVYDNLFDVIKNTEQYCQDQYNTSGIYVGNTIDPDSKEISYGGSVFINRFFGTTKRVPVNPVCPTHCELGNANIMWVPRKVVQKIGILSKGYVHGVADYDYTLKANKVNIPILTMPGIQGVCINDHPDPYIKFMELSLSDRVKMLYNPVGLDFKSHITYMKNHFPIRLPLVYATGWFKVLFPKVYIMIFNNRREIN